MKRLSVVIVNYNVAQFLEICLHSVYASTIQSETDVWVVDNNSSDGSLEVLQDKFPQVKLIANKKNIGFSAANNQALQAANTEYVLLLNPDTIVPEDCFEKCLRFMDEHPEAGGLGVRMIDGSGNFLPESKRGLPGPWVSFCKAFGLGSLFPHSALFGGYYLSYLSEHQVHEVDVLSGAYMLMRREALEKTGFLDESFFMYGEDVDLSYRLQKAGYRNYYFPESSIIHFKGESTRRGSISFVKNFYRAMLLFSEKHFSRNRWFTLFIYLGIGVRASLALAKRLFDFSAVFLLEFAISYLGMAIIKDWWELNFKGVPGMYPDFFIQLLVPAYIFVWLGSIRLVTAYSKDFGPAVIIKGIVLGTVLISGITNFFDDYRFSKGLILLGAAWTWTACTLRIVGWQLFKMKKLLFSLNRKRRILAVADESAFQHASTVLGHFQQEVLICGRCGPQSSSDKSYLGTELQIPEFAFRLGLDELLFCQQSISNASIIAYLEKFKSLQLKYSFIGPGSRYLVSSSEKHHRGNILKSESMPELLFPHNLRLKRLTDLAICFLLLPLLPVILLRISSVKGFFRNYLEVLAGERTWNGTENQEWQRFGLRPAVVTTRILAGKNALPALVEGLDKLYLQEFLAEHEIWTIFKNLHQLGNRRDSDSELPA